jgi:hypothetical protein
MTPHDEAAYNRAKEGDMIRSCECPDCMAYRKDNIGRGVRSKYVYFQGVHLQFDEEFLTGPFFASVSLPKVLWYIRLWRWIWRKK